MSDPIAPEALADQPKPAAAEAIQLPDDHPLVKTLAAQKEQLQKLKAERAADAEKASKWDAAEAAQLSAIEKAEKRAEAAEKELNATRLEALRASVALAKGLTPTQAKRLIGSTSEELEADADELLADIKNTKPGSAPSSEGQGKQGEPVGQTKQITSRDQLSSMTREEQLAAYRNGELKALTG